MPQPRKSSQQSSGSTSSRRSAGGTRKSSSKSASSRSGGSSRSSGSSRASSSKASSSGSRSTARSSGSKASTTRSRSASTSSRARTTAAGAAGGADARVEALAERVRKLNERIIEAGRDAGETTLSAYERALKTIAASMERGAGASDIEWLSQLLNTQAKFIRDITNSWTSAARGVLK
jgi:hypothetical protein